MYLRVPAQTSDDEEIEVFVNLNPELLAPVALTLYYIERAQNAMLNTIGEVLESVTRVEDAVLQLTFTVPDGLFFYVDRRGEEEDLFVESIPDDAISINGGAISVARADISVLSWKGHELLIPNIAGLLGLAMAEGHLNRQELAKQMAEINKLGGTAVSVPSLQIVAPYQASD